MLSRSNSNAGERLRRAKSTSSTHTSSSGHQRTQTSIDPFVTRQHAEVAALEAYHRARVQEEPTHPAYRPVPPKLQRRHSQVTGKAEGGHLEEARLGRRKSYSRKGNVSGTKPVRAQQQWPSNVVDESTGDEIKIRRRYVVPPNPDVRAASQYEQLSLPASSRYVRRSETGYTDGSPLPRNSTTLRDRSSNIGDAGDTAHTSDLHASDDPTMHTGTTPKPSIRETRTDQDNLASARDKCLQDFHRNPLRERKSFILAPFQKRRAMTSHTNGEAAFDTKLPPFNYAESFMPPPPPPPPAPVIAAPSLTIKTEKKSRNFSDSLKGRLKKVFRKSSRVSSGLPAQHIEAKRFHYTTFSSLKSSELGAEDDPFRDTFDQTSAAAPEYKTDSANSSNSAGEQSTTKSRVTSWTNSTAGGTLGSRNGPELEELPEECGQLRRSDSISTLRKASSFFGRPIKARLRRPSKAELQSSEESAELYSALQERIKPLDSTSRSPSSPSDELSTTTSALATLPSQQKAESIASSKRSWVVPAIATIRSVTPEPNAYKLDIPSPVTEVLSPDPALPCQNHLVPHDTHESNLTPRNQLQRRPAMKAPTPSKDQIARRVEKSKNRWQSPLNEFSPPPPISTRAATMEDNPYELRSLSRTLQQPLAVITSSDIPHHAKVSERIPATREDVLSPSVYSRGTDGGSPGRGTPVEKGDMMVTITSREVRSYSLSPPKRAQREEKPGQGSGEWRRWLSGEMNGWGEQSALREFEIPEIAVRDYGQVERDVVATPRQDDLEAGEGVMGASQQALRDLQGGSVVFERQPSSEGNEPSNAAGEATMSTIKQKSLTSSKSTTHLISGGNRHDNLLAQDAEPTSEKAPQPRSTHLTPALTNPPYKPKSAFDLRANYKSTSSSTAKPLAVRRRPHKQQNEKINILEDTTIQNISAGPYASLQPTSSNTPTATDANKENTAPSPPTPPSPARMNVLPVLPSSEWLAAGANRKRESKITSAARSRSVSRRSPAVTGTGDETMSSPGGSSPGQRMVTNWLDGKRSKENSPAFV